MYFRQLPFIWNKKYLTFLAEISRMLIPNFLYNSTSVNPVNKWIRFSKEIMLLSSSIKPELKN